MRNKLIRRIKLEEIGKKTPTIPIKIVRRRCGEVMASQSEGKCKRSPATSGIQPDVAKACNEVNRVRVRKA